MSGTITQLWRFPVKSMQGEQVERSTLGPAGLDGDRRYALVHDDTGKVLTAKRYGDLLLATARTKGDQVVIALPDGTEHLAGDPDTDAAITAWLGQPCHLAEPPAGAGAPEFDMSFDAEHPDQDMFAWPVAAGTYLDLAGAHLLTTSSLAAGRRLHPDGDWDVRRFRPTAGWAPRSRSARPRWRSPCSPSAVPCRPAGSPSFRRISAWPTPCAITTRTTSAYTETCPDPVWWPWATRWCPFDRAVKERGG